MKKLSLSALAAVCVLAGMTGANAADLGGNCCADLEERIAELEATTARKGNRKVSLTISGWVSQEVSIWNDGVRTKAYVSDIGNTLDSNVKFTGQAQINSDWSAGYVLQIEFSKADALTTTQAGPGTGVGANLLQSFWFVKSNTLGKLSIGLQSSAADNAALLPDGSGSLVPANYILYEANGFFLRKSNGQFVGGAAPSLTVGSFATCPGLQAGVGADCDGVPNNNIRYDTPTFGGFSASVSWGEADIWAVSGRYAAEFGDLKFSVASAYDESTAQSITNNNTLTKAGQPTVRVQGGSWQTGAYLQHIPTGLFVYGAYDKDYNTRVSGFAGKPDGDNYYIKAGIRQKWSPLGHTVLFGEYANNHNKQSIADWDSGITSSNLDQWGLGLVQEIDAAAMSMFFTYRNYSASATCVQGLNGQSGCDAGINAGLQDFQVFKAGALINF